MRASINPPASHITSCLERVYSTLSSSAFISISKMAQSQASRNRQPRKNGNANGQQNNLNPNATSFNIPKPNSKGKRPNQPVSAELSDHQQQQQPGPRSIGLVHRPLRFPTAKPLTIQPKITKNLSPVVTPVPTSLEPAIPVNDAPNTHLEKLQDLVISPELQKQYGFPTQQLQDYELRAKRHCVKCDKSFGLRVRTLMDGPLIVNIKGVDVEIERKPPIVCRFHSGQRDFHLKQWTCCNKSYFDRDTGPCQQSTEHVSRKYSPGELERNWKFHSTPEPTSAGSQQHRKAVAIDCEMGSNADNESELIRLSVVDYFTNEVLVDSLIYPNIPIRDFRTRFSGVSRNQMNDAYRRRTCFMGRDAARTKLWDYIGPDTIVITHAGDNDFKALRWIHGRIIDTMRIEQKIHNAELARIAAAEVAAARAKKEEEKAQRIADGLLEEEEEWESNLAEKEKPKKTEREKGPRKPRVKGSGPTSLKQATLKRLGRPIQLGNNGHCSLEDALATSDLARWHVLNGLVEP
jgi:RNA exonuclease 1